MQPSTKSPIKKPLAVWFSRVLHPLILSTLVLVLFQYLSGTSFTASIAWTLLVVSLLILPVMSFVLFRVGRGRYADADVSVREDRRLLYGLAGGCFISVVLLLKLLNAPDATQVPLQAALFAFMVAGVLNFFMLKTSLHMLAIGGSVALVLASSPILALGLTLLSVGLGWSRLYLSRHSLAEVIAGWVIGVACFAVWVLSFSPP